MLNRRIAPIMGIAACAIFWTAMVVFGALRPSYSQATDDISVLGALGTSHAMAWNVLGFIFRASDSPPPAGRSPSQRAAGGRSLCGSRRGSVRCSASASRARACFFSAIAVLLVLAGSFSRAGGLPDGLAQRLVDAVVFAWLVVMCVKLIRNRSS